MTERAERILLARHGTVDVALPPSAILAAAKEDFARREMNRAQARNGVSSAPEGYGGYLRYAFLVGHVRNAKSPADILKRALAWRQRPDFDSPGDRAPIPKLSLLHLTASVENLTLAIQLAEEEMNRLQDGE